MSVCTLFCISLGECWFIIYHGQQQSHHFSRNVSWNNRCIIRGAQNLRIPLQTFGKVIALHHEEKGASAHCCGHEDIIHEHVISTSEASHEENVHKSCRQMNAYKSIENICQAYWWFWLPWSHSVEAGPMWILKFLEECPIRCWSFFTREVQIN